MPSDWSFYEVVVGVIALLFTLIGGGWALYERSKNKKDLRYLPSESTSLILDRPNIGQLVVLYNDVKVKDPQIISIECKNNGRIPIAPDDFIKPLSISGSGKVLSAVVSKVNPDGLNPSFNIADNEVLIEPLLLNGGDTFTLNLLTDGEYVHPKISARIKGVKEIKRITKVSEKTKSFILAIIGLIIGVLSENIFDYISSIF